MLARSKTEREKASKTVLQKLKLLPNKKFKKLLKKREKGDIAQIIQNTRR